MIGPDALARVGHVERRARHDGARVGVRTTKVDASDHATYLTLPRCRQPLPLFPLNTPLVPGLVLPLHIFEPRYREMVEELLAIPDEDEREFGIVAVRDGHDVAPDGHRRAVPRRHGDDPAAGRAPRRRALRHRHDGQPPVPARSTSTPAEPLLRGARSSSSTTSSDPADALLADAGRPALPPRTARALSGQVPDAVEPTIPTTSELPDDPTVLSYLVTAAMVLPTDERQCLLAAPTTGDRLALARSLLGRETAPDLRAVRRAGARPARRRPVGELSMAARDPGTPAHLALTRAGIAFTAHAYEHDPRAASYGLEAAEALGLTRTRCSRPCWRWSTAAPSSGSSR